MISLPLFHWNEFKAGMKSDMPHFFVHFQLLATGSMDKMVRISTTHHLNYILTIKISAKILHMFQVKLWDLSNNHPSCVASTNPKAVSPPNLHFSNKMIYNPITAKIRNQCHALIGYDHVLQVYI